MSLKEIKTSHTMSKHLGNHVKNHKNNAKTTDNNAKTTENNVKTPRKQQLKLLKRRL